MLRHFIASFAAIVLCSCAGEILVPQEPAGEVYEFFSPRPVYVPETSPELGCPTAPVTGRVLAAYSIRADGTSYRVAVIESGGKLLDGCVYRSLGKVRFEVPKDWAAIGGPSRRYRQGFIFEVFGREKVQPFDRNVAVTVVNTTRVRRCRDGEAGDPGLPAGICLAEGGQ